ncbi:ThiF family adenylyltransferase [Nonomuraea ferruginea]
MWRRGVPFVTGGFNQHVGLVGPLVVPGKTGCLSCQERSLAARYGRTELPTGDNPGRVIPSFGPLCQIVAGMLASEVLRYLTGAGTAGGGGPERVARSADVDDHDEGVPPV